MQQGVHDRNKDLLLQMNKFDLGTLVSRIEVPVRLFFFAFFPQPVCLIWVYVFNRFLKKMTCLFAYLGHVCLSATIFIEFFQMYSSTIHQKSQ